jgi:hypothetical protein
MTHLNPGKTGLAVGKLFAVVHLIWAIIVGLGWGQALVNVSMWAHMVGINVIVQPFNLTAAVVLIIVTFVAGSVIGYVFANMWNWVQR